MKSAFFALLSLAATSAYAAPLSCNTNDGNPRLPNTNVTVTMVGQNRAEISQVTSGGMAHFITAPVKIDVNVKRHGPEVVEFQNTEQGFDLVVNYQPIGGKIHGTLTSDLFIKMNDVPVICVQALN